MKTPISYYTLRGNHPKKTLVFLHGFLEDSTVWKTLSEALSNTYKTISTRKNPYYCPYTHYGNDG